MVACGRTNSKLLIAIYTIIIPIVDTMNLNRTWMTCLILVDEFDTHLGPLRAELEPLWGASSWCSRDPPKARPPSLTDEERGEVAKLDGGTCRPWGPLIPTTGTYTNIHDTHWSRLIV
jgi:hypothetical protein